MSEKHEAVAGTFLQYQSPDEWTGIRDPRKRKAIQDKLAQRARRQRLALENPKLKRNAEKGWRNSVRFLTLAPKPSSAGKQTAAETKIGLGNIATGPHGFGNNQERQRDQTNSIHQHDNSSSNPNGNSHQIPKATSFRPTLDNDFLTLHSLSVVAVLHSNAQLQGISCLFPIPLISPQGTEALPLPLHPTSLQMTRVHLPYIGCFPLANLRKNLIMWNGLFGEEEFCGDLITTTSFVISGGQSWDPVAWVLDPAFKEKWRFLKGEAS